MMFSPRSPFLYVNTNIVETSSDEDDEDVSDDEVASSDDEDYASDTEMQDSDDDEDDQSDESDSESETGDNPPTCSHRVLQHLRDAIGSLSAAAALIVDDTHPRLAVAQNEASLAQKLYHFLFQCAQQMYLRYGQIMLAIDECRQNVMTFVKNVLTEVHWIVTEAVTAFANFVVSIRAVEINLNFSVNAAREVSDLGHVADMFRSALGTVGQLQNMLGAVWAA